MGGRRQRVQGNRLRIIRIQIPFGTGTFLGHAGGVRGDDAKLVVSRDIDEKNLQKVMAYLFVTILFSLISRSISWEKFSRCFFSAE